MKRARQINNLKVEKRIIKQLIEAAEQKEPNNLILLNALEGDLYSIREQIKTCQEKLIRREFAIQIQQNGENIKCNELHS